MDQKTVVVAMSGGVDSSVTALLMKQQGYKVIGLFMKNWEEKDEDGVCRSSHDYADVIKVCDQLGIPYYSVNFVQEYWDHVFAHFLEELKLGFTPNPDILCNREIKFKVLLAKALEIGGDFLVTGHYCRSACVNGQWQLLKGLDPEKDQSYFLYAIQQQALQHVQFPVGGMLKKELRALASKFQLATSLKKDSTGICFIGERNFKQFLSNYIAYHPGNFETLNGKIVGQHEGVAYYTPGQRRGLAIGGPGDPWYVLDKDIARNVVYVGQGEFHPAMYCDELTAVEETWISDTSPTLPFRCTAKVRYRQTDQECEIVSREQGQLLVRFATPQRAVTPRQSIVFYQNDICLGGAIIKEPGPSYFVQGRLPF